MNTTPTLLTAVHFKKVSEQNQVLRSFTGTVTEVTEPTFS